MGRHIKVLGGGLFLFLEPHPSTWTAPYGIFHFVGTGEAQDESGRHHVVGRKPPESQREFVRPLRVKKNIRV